MTTALCWTFRTLRSASQGLHMIEQAKKRPLFQIHLSTAVVLMFVAGGLIWANTTPGVVSSESKVIGYSSSMLSSGQCISNEYIISEGVSESEFLVGIKGGYEWRCIRCYTCGWPYDLMQVNTYLKVMNNGERESRIEGREWNGFAIIANIVIAGIVFISTKSVCECQIRRSGPNPVPEGRSKGSSKL